MTTPGGTIRPGTIYSRDSTLALIQNDMTFQWGRCTGAGPGTTTCTYTVKIGRTVTLVATDVAAAVSVDVNTLAADLPEPRTIQSQFASWSAPCATPERGVCAPRRVARVLRLSRSSKISDTPREKSGRPPQGQRVVCLRSRFLSK